MRRLCRAPRARHGGRGGDQGAQPRQGVLPVLLETAVGLRLDHHIAVRADPMILHPKQACLDGVGQGRGADVESQVDGVGDLVDVLAARSLSADRVDLDLALPQDGGGRVSCQGSPLRAGTP